MYNFFPDNFNLFGFLLNMIDHSLNLYDLLHLNYFLHYCRHLYDFRHLLGDINDFFNDCGNFDDLVDYLFNWDNLLLNLDLDYWNFQRNMHNLLNLLELLHLNDLLNLFGNRNHNRNFNSSFDDFFSDFFHFHYLGYRSKYSQYVIHVDDTCDLCCNHSQNTFINLQCKTCLSL